jgi:hypothetical protein
MFQLEAGTNLRFEVVPASKPSEHTPKSFGHKHARILDVSALKSFPRFMRKKVEKLFAHEVESDPRMMNPSIPNYLKGGMRNTIALMAFSYATGQPEQAQKLDRLVEKEYDRLLERSLNP